VITDDPGFFEPEKLRAFDAVVMNNTVNQSVFLTADEQKRLKAKDAAVQGKWERLKKSLSDFVTGGRGVVAFHGGADCGGMWPEYVEMIGGHFAGHPWSAKVVCRVESKDNAINAAVLPGKDFVEWADEIYIFSKEYSRQTHRVLLSLDLEQCAAMYKDPVKWAADRGRPDGDNPMIWIKRHGQGRVYYSAFGGHLFEMTWTPDLVRHWLAGIQYALGDLKADDSPSGAASRPKIPSDAQVERIAAAAPTKAAAPKRPRKLLVFRGETSMPGRFTAAAIEQMGKKTRAYETEVASDVAVLAADRLRGYDALCLIDAGALQGGKRPDKEQLAKISEMRRGLIRYVEEGHGLIVLGPAGEAAKGWTELGELLGATPQWAPWTKAVLRKESPDHPVNVAADCPPEFEVADRIYLLGDPYSHKAVRVLLSVDVEKSGIAGNKTQADRGRADGDYAVSWTKTAGQGRVYCNTLGSQPATSTHAVVLRHWLAGIQYALGDN
jgi:hypothetical protein